MSCKQSNVCHRLYFRHRDQKFSDIVPNTITIINKNEKQYANNRQLNRYSPLKNIRDF